MFKKKNWESKIKTGKSCVMKGQQGSNMIV